jgi:hypothetical protein
MTFLDDSRSTSPLSTGTGASQFVQQACNEVLAIAELTRMDTQSIANLCGPISHGI